MEEGKTMDPSPPKELPATGTFITAPSKTPPPPAAEIAVVKETLSSSVVQVSDNGVSFTVSDCVSDDKTKQKPVCSSVFQCHLGAEGCNMCVHVHSVFDKYMTMEMRVDNLTVIEMIGEIVGQDLIVRLQINRACALMLSPYMADAVVQILNEAQRRGVQHIKCVERRAPDFMKPNSPDPYADELACRFFTDKFEDVPLSEALIHITNYRDSNQLPPGCMLNRDYFGMRK